MRRRDFLSAAGGLTTLAFGRGLAAQQINRSTDGLVDVDLEARDNWVTLAGRQAYLSAFNSQVPGPVIEARAGDTVRIRFRNSLAEDSNLHYHGLHIPPTGISDNSFIEVPAGESFTYEFAIPKDHPSGMFWYHPHMHGSVARQVSRGMAGVIVIRGGLDLLPEVQSIPEFVMVLQDFDLSADGMVIEPTTMEMIQGREGPLVTVNGALNPTIPVQSQGWTRLRILNASVSRFYSLRIDEHSFNVIGTDGGTIQSPFETAEILLVPGQRVDTLVWGGRSAGRYRLLNLPYDRLGMMMGGGMGAIGSGAGAEVLSTLEYASTASSAWTLPVQLGAIEPLPAPDRLRSFTFAMGMGMGMRARGGSFTINGRQFDPNRVDTRVVLNSVEDWDVINTSAMDHPFHIHTNPFQVVAHDGSVERAWRDVVLVRGGASIRVRMRFADFAGKAMYHCHILDHEDLGMMGVFEVT